jgi:hypothetical protein
MIGIGMVLSTTIVAVVWAEAQLLRQKERDHPPSEEE